MTGNQHPTLANALTLWLLWRQGFVTPKGTASASVIRCFFMSTRIKPPKGSLVRVGAKLSAMGVDKNNYKKPLGERLARRFVFAVTNYPTPSKVLLRKKKTGGQQWLI